MARRKSRKTSNLSLAEGLFIFGIFIYVFLKKVKQIITSSFQEIKSTFEHFTAIEWLLAIVFLFCFIVLIIQIRKVFIQNNIKRNEVKSFKRISHIRRVYRTSSYEELISMNPFEFEQYIADLFTLKGYLSKVTPKSRDGGKDIILLKDNKKYIVECKRHNKKNKISRSAIQKFHSAIIDTEAESGFFVTTSFFTKDAMEYVKNKQIELIDLHSLEAMIDEVEQIS